MRADLVRGLGALALRTRHEILRLQRQMAAALALRGVRDAFLGMTSQILLSLFDGLGRGGTLASLAEQGPLPLGRPHLAQALFEAGHVPTYDSAFDTLISKESPAYVSRVGLTPLEAVSLARKHGGVPSLAHPGTVVDLERLLPQLVASGLVGMECYYGSHTAAFTAMCLRLCGRYGLVPTGGSDFHGRGEHGTDLGGVFVPEECIGALEARRAGN